MGREEKSYISQDKEHTIVKCIVCHVKIYVVIQAWKLITLLEGANEFNPHLLPRAELSFSFLIPNPTKAQPPTSLNLKFQRHKGKSFSYKRLDSRGWLNPPFSILTFGSTEVTVVPEDLGIFGIKQRYNHSQHTISSSASTSGA